MRRGTKVVVGAGVAVVVLGGAAFAFGPGLYADYQNSRADAVPTVENPVGATDGGTTAGTDPEEGPAVLGDLAALDGTWDVAGDSFAGYRVNEVLRGEDVTVTGRTDDVDGSVTLEDGAITAARIDVDMTSVTTDSAQRDGYFRDTALEVGTFPTASFELTGPVELTEGLATVDLPGELTVHGVTQAVTVEAQVGGTGADPSTADSVQVAGSVPITFSDFDVEAPSLGFVTVEETGSVEFLLDLVRSR